MASGDSIAGFSVHRGSDEGFEFECDPCKLDDIFREGKHYCPTCEEYLCDNCLSHHRRLKASRSHQIVSGEDIPKTTSASKTVSNRILCSCSQNDIEWYCNTHKDAFCSTCKAVKHRKCETSVLDEVVRKEPVARQYNTMIEELDQLVTQASQVEKLQTYLLKVLNDNGQTCKNAIKSSRRDIDEYLDKLEKQSVDKLDTHIAKEKAAIGDRKTVCNDISQTFISNKIAALEVNDRNDAHEMFINYLKFYQSISEYKTAIQDVKTDSTVHEFFFERNKYLARIPSKVHQFGDFHGLDKDTCMSPQIKTSILELDAEQSGEVNIPASSAELFSYGSVFLENGDFLVADNRNQNLVLLDRTFHIKQDMKVKGSIWDVTEISNTQALCSLSIEKALLFVQIYPQLTVINRIQCDSYCYGVRYFNNSIYVSCFDGNVGDVRILNSKGELKQKIPLTAKGSKVNSKPYNLTVNSTGDKLYVSDYHTDSVICLSTAGDVIFTYSNNDLRHPRQVLVDKFNNFFVCNQAGNNIHIVRSDGTFQKKLFDIKNPLMLAYRESDGTLIVNGSSGKFLIYKLKRN